VDKAFAQDEAHQEAECSNAGTCDRVTGQCVCIDGFTGSACQRSELPCHAMFVCLSVCLNLSHVVFSACSCSAPSTCAGSCPGDCSGHGTCLTLSDASLLKGSGLTAEQITLSTYSSDAALAGDLFNELELQTYLNWDASSVLMCNCDPAYFGADCSLRMCPKGDDPWTTDQNDRAIGLVVSSLDADVALDGLLGIKLYGETTYVSLDSSTTDEDCALQLQNSSQIEAVACNYTRVSALQVRLALTFTAWPSYGLPDNNVYVNSGNPAVTEFYCDVSQLVGLPSDPGAHNSTVQCSFYDIQTRDIKGKQETVVGWLVG
jgi:hypothetical protein